MKRTDAEWGTVGCAILLQRRRMFLICDTNRLF
jgi:hypothetical protein